MKEAITVMVRTRGQGTAQPHYRGMLCIRAPWGRYYRTAGPWRIKRGDALDDARRAKADWDAVGQLPV